ncbi:MAG: serine/threonine protein kinase, partial [Gemmataceae bacterium]
MLGQVLLGRYKITRALDEGGMSKIYLAHQTAPDRDVVVKVLKDHLRTQNKPVEHFRREIHIMTRLQHPHAVAAYDSIPRDPRGPILIMEYVRGIDLCLLQNREGRFSPERVGRLLVQLCDVLHYCHTAGVVHRDLKPGNVMIVHAGTPQESVKVMDFGLAKMSNMLYISPEEIVDFNLPAASGTPEYISPEMVRGNDMDGRGDLYSVGVMLFEMLTGRRPFVCDGVEQLMLAHANDAPPTFLEAGCRDVPAGIEAVVRSCLEKYPEKRPANALELAAAYERALGKKLPAARTAAPAGNALRSGGG